MINKNIPQTVEWMFLRTGVAVLKCDETNVMLINVIIIANFRNFS